jgi:ABC-2 type transport system permease protein
VPFLGFLQRLFGNEVLQDPRHYRVEVWTICYHYFLLAELRFSMLLVLMVGPNLISQDLRFNALPLYFSRPVRRIDYFLGKLGIITVFLGLIVIVPSMIAYGLGLLFSLDVTIIRDTFRLLLASVAYGVVISVSAGLLILALSSLSRNSRYVALFWLAILMVSGIVATVLNAVEHQQRARAFYANNADARSDRSTEDLLTEELEASKTNWRPLVSYTANLSRIGQYLLGTDTCWEKISQSWRPRERLRFLSNFVGPQFPWYWSAVVLAALFGISACILNFQIKSLDRLK